MSGYPTLDDFTRHLNDTFRVRLEPTPIELELVEAVGLGSRRGDPPRTRGFSVLFRGPAAPGLPQRIYHLEHAGLGALDIFLVPIGRDERGMLYEAVFN
jgi:hypothetical protein